MQLALNLARRGEGAVEPNPMVGCVIARGAEVIATGWHASFGGDHAEAAAIKNVPPERQGDLAEATLYVTLEPCSHFGKTPPCCEAILATPIRRVVVARRDPFPEVAGRGLTRLREAGVEVVVGVGDAQAAALIAPFEMLVSQQRPWVIAKWAMTLDGKIAAHTGDSQWISGESSRKLVHELRGKVDAIAVGAGTAGADDPMLSARPPGPRVATRVVFDSRAELSPASKLATSSSNIPVLIFVGEASDPARRQQLTDTGCEVVVLPDDRALFLREAMLELGRRKMTNLLVEGGGQLLGGLFDADLIDEVMVFVAPKIIGGAGAVSPIAGMGLAEMARAPTIVSPFDHGERAQWRQVEGDLVLHGRIVRS